MPLKDVIVAALSRPAAKVVDAPVREIVAEVLRDHGYAGPAELATLRDELSGLRAQSKALAGRVEALDARLGSVSADADAWRAQAALAHDEARLARQEAAASQSQSQAALEALRAELHALQHARAEAPVVAPVPPVAAPVAAAPVAAAPVAAAPVAADPVAAEAPQATSDDSGARCRVAGCEEDSYTQGFCLAHGDDWRAGRLPGFVGPEGLLEVDGRPLRVASGLAGLPYTVGDNGRLRIGGRFATATPLA